MRPVLWAGVIGGGLLMIVLAVCVGRYFATPSTVEPAPATDASKTDQLEATRKRIAEIRRQKEKIQKAQEDANRRREEEALKKHPAPASPP
jgi:Tfp pilus assembly protein PilN